MSLFEQISNDNIQALRDKNTLKRGLLSTLKGDLEKNIKPDADGIKQDPTDQECIQMIKKFLNNLNITFKESVGKRDVVNISHEMIILEDYLPKQMDEAQIRGALEAFRGKGLGAAMKYFKDTYAGLYDGALVSKIAREIV